MHTRDKAHLGAGARAGGDVSSLLFLVYLFAIGKFESKDVETREMEEEVMFVRFAITSLEK